ncbi:hypothetical protein ACLOJK_022774 [Asimina triloba]
MEKNKLFANVSISPHWQSPPSSMNCISQPLESGFLNLNWETSLDHGAPFESALNSVISSAAPATTSFSSNALCYGGGVPSNSPPKLNLSGVPENPMLDYPTLAPFSTDPGFVERAAKFSCFSNGSYGALTGKLGFPETEFTQRPMLRMGSGKLSRVSSSQSLKHGTQMGALDKKEIALPDGLESEARSVSVSASASDRKFGVISRSSTPDTAEFGNSREESSPSDMEMGLNGQPEINARKRKAMTRAKAKELPLSSPSATDSKEVGNSDSNPKRSKTTEANTKDGAKQSSEQGHDNQKAADGNQKQSKDSQKPPEPPKDYIHVRARRGQATDSHSLAERVRREKISERMKFLQDLVPGCSKVTGKAVMLDEIINYVQSLQRQVEFLSMKLANVNPRLDFKMENLLSKDKLQPHGSLPNPMHHPFDASSTSSAPLPAFPFSQQQPHHPLLHGSASHATQLPIIDACGDASSQVISRRTNMLRLRLLSLGKSY